MIKNSIYIILGSLFLMSPSYAVETGLHPAVLSSSALFERITLSEKRLSEGIITVEEARGKLSKARFLNALMHIFDSSKRQQIVKDITELEVKLELLMTLSEQARTEVNALKEVHRILSNNESLPLRSKAQDHLAQLASISRNATSEGWIAFRMGEELRAALGVS